MTTPHLSFDLNEPALATLDQFVENPDNIRTTFDGIKELAQSIATVGLMDPLRVREQEDGKLLVIDGNRRLRAMRSLNGDAPKAIPWIPVGDGEQGDVLTQLISGLQKRTLSVQDEATGFQRAMGLGMKISELAKAVGFPQTYVKQRLALLSVPEDLRTPMLKWVGVSATAALGAALAKHPTVIDRLPEFELPDYDSDDLEDWQQDELRDSNYWPDPQWVEIQVTDQQAMTEAHELAKKLESTDVHVSVQPWKAGMHWSDWVQIYSGENEYPINYQQPGQRVTKAELTKLRRSEYYVVVLTYGVQIVEKGELKPQVRKIEFVTNPSVLPEPEAKSQSDEQKSAVSQAVERQTAEQAAQKEAKRIQRLKVKALLGGINKLPAKVRGDAPYHAADAIIHTYGHALDRVATALGVEPEKQGDEDFTRPTRRREALEDYIRESKANLDKFFLAWVLCENVRSTEDGLAIWIDAQIPTEQVG